MKKKSVLSKRKRDTKKLAEKRVALRKAIKDHKEVVLPPHVPKVTKLGYVGQSYNHSLLNGESINVGDKLVFTQIVTVRTITRTEGSKNVHVDVDKISDTWSHKRD